MWKAYSVLSFLWAGVIFAGSALPLRLPGWTMFPYSDTLAHFLEYAVLAFLIHRALIRSPGKRARNAAPFFAFFIAASYGASLEFYQWFLPYRDCTILDVVANCAGAACAAGMGGADG